ncbi:hypothetical protein DICPUDRAFT_155715 [Dictyostelium purpureum]|uniref:Uncharacterized protein n=1 Tax=Dictyostelium purpureum TaxID=5786 RepID=F0ZUP6_DICPU|nr:uncharacterized protein DICPUDRAFT_155715 [Dictyostelium purpureum]EGC32333.1 hypothetical protein DICPUDRAFT_155715 [Dictyostelium purpureum]|eukprot:XP_003291135.1 hypothetical protein DICPUDRAFT_155715 [Dictyostelium purpureum]
MFKYYLLFILLILLCRFSVSFNTENQSDSKYHILKYYNNDNCTGDVTMIRALLYSNDYCINFPYPQNLEILDGGVRLSSCDCSKDNSTCGFYIGFGDCVNGTKLFYEPINYYEGDFCVTTETNIFNKEILDYRFIGFTASRRNTFIKHAQVMVKCDFEKLLICDEPCIEIPNNYRIFGAGASFHLLLMEDLNFLIKPIFKGTYNSYWKDVFETKFHGSSKESTI